MNGLMHQSLRPVAVERVVDELSGAPVLYEPQSSEQLQLPRGCCDRALGELRKVTYAKLFQGQRIEQPKTSRVSQGPEGVSDAHRDIGGGQSARDGDNLPSIDAIDEANARHISDGSLFSFNFKLLFHVCIVMQTNKLVKSASFTSCRTAA